MNARRNAAQCETGSVSKTDADSTRGRGRPPRLTQAAVLDAAARLLRASGSEALTMKSLAASLDVSTMALYRHVRDRDALLIAVLNREVEQLERPPMPDDPERRVLAVFGWLYDGLDARPWVVDVISRGDFYAPAVLWALEAILSSLVSAGLTAEQAVDVYLALWRFTIGTLQLKHAGRPTVEKLGREPILDASLRGQSDAARPILARVSAYWPRARDEFDYAAALRGMARGLIADGLGAGPSDSR